MSSADMSNSLELSDEELKLLTYLLEQEGIDLPKPQTIFPRGERAVLPLSFAQERLWFLDRWDPGSAAYNVPSAVRLAGRLDRRALLAGLNEVIRRHEALRTTFPAIDERPAQVIAPAFRLRLPLVDLRALPDALRERVALRLLSDQARQPFDLAAGPLVHALLVWLTEIEHIFLLSMHHIVCDGWSITVFIQELAALYRAFALGQPSPLPDLPIQYADFAIWQRGWLQGEVLETQLGYWKDSLAGLPVLDLPTDRPRPPVQTHRGGREEVVIAGSTVEALQALCREQGATLFMALLAGFGVLLARYSGQNDIIIGSPIANRDLVEIEGLIGYFVNTLVLRIDLSRPASFRELARQVRDTTLEAHAHQNLPFEQLVEALQPARDPSRTPLFQVMFVLQNTPLPAYELPDLTMSPIAVENGTAKFDLLLTIAETARGLLARIEYNSDLFDAATAQRILDHFQNLLRHAVTDPGGRVAELPLMSPAERAQILVAWNQTDTGLIEESVEHLIAGQAARRSDAVALVFEATDDERRRTNDERGTGEACLAPTQHLTYAALNARANRLAHHLRARGVGPEALVALHLDRSIELIVGLLGVLKAGGAYLPLDPAYPSQRISFMLEDSGAAVLITATYSRDRETRRRGEGEMSLLPFSSSPLLLFSRNVVDLHADAPQIAAMPATSPHTNVQAENTAYVIYTSGSTGAPKGVLVTRGALANHCQAAIGSYDLCAEDRVLQLAPLSFDLAAEEIYPTLASGAALVFWPQKTAATPHELLALAGSERLTVLDLATPLWQVWATEQAGSALDVPAALRLVIVGGDLALAEAYAAWRRAAPDWVRWINTYGPTEATIIATMYEPDAGVLAQPWGGVAIGRPISNTQVYILDQRMQPAPIGVPGELYIGGAGLARGYLNRPELTAERFIPNPFATAEDERRKTNDERLDSSFVVRRSSRLYRTGDLARYRPDGAIEFLGRRDAQIKLRGFRIELDEIEAALQRHPAVREAAAAVRETPAGDRLLVAYIVEGSEVRGQGSGVSGLPTGDERRTTNDESIDTSFIVRRSSFVSELKSFLAERLPDYMLPALIVPIAELPRLPNGKLDRRALPSPDSRAGSSAPLAPRDRLELLLVQLWEELLARRPIGVADHFFALGGHSLLAVRLMARLREHTGVALPLATLFRHPTVEQLARVLRGQTAPAAPSALVGIATAGSSTPLFCIHPLGGNVLCYAQLARQLAPHQPVYGIQSPGLEHDQPPLAELEAMAAHYVEAIRAAQPEGPYLLCGWSVGGIIALEVAQQLLAAGQAVALLALLDSHLRQPRRLPDDLRLLVGMAQQLGVRVEPASLEPLEAEQQLAYVLEQARRRAATLPELDLAQFKRLFAVYKANAQALLAYTPRAYPGRVALFRATETAQEHDGAAEWEVLAAGGVELYEVAAGHDTMLREPHVRELAERLREAIARAQGQCAADTPPPSIPPLDCRPHLLPRLTDSR